MAPTYVEELETAKSAIWKTVNELELYRRSKRDLKDSKSDHPLDRLTSLDEEAEEKIVQRLRKDFDYDFLTEESNYNRSSDAYWCIDPIDGTTNFSRGFSPWGVSIALIIDSKTVAAAVALLPEGRMFSAIKGEGAYVEDDLNFSNMEAMPDYHEKCLRGEKLEVSKVDSIEEMMFKTANNDKSKDYSSMVNFIREIEEKGASIRNNGCCTADLCAIAEGGLDGRANANIKSWDIDAGKLIVSEAGGSYRERETEEGYIEFIASNGALQERIEKLWDKTHRK